MTNRLRPPQGAPACSGGPTSVSDAEAGLGTRRELAVCVQSNSSLSTLILNNSKHNYTTNHSGGGGGPRFGRGRGGSASLPETDTSELARLTFCNRKHPKPSVRKHPESASASRACVLPRPPLSRSVNRKGRAPSASLRRPKPTRAAGRRPGPRSPARVGPPSASRFQPRGAGDTQPAGRRRSRGWGADPRGPARPDAADTRAALTFRLAPPRDTLGLVLKSPSKLNIFTAYPIWEGPGILRAAGRAGRARGRGLRRGGRGSAGRRPAPGLGALPARACPRAGGR